MMLEMRLIDQLQKPEGPQADGWGVLMEPRLAFVSAGVCGRGALRGLIAQVPR